MNLFYIDTSSSYLYSGIVSNNSLKASRKVFFGSELSKYALNEISKMFEEINILPKDIDKIIVVAGPGSFTGIRIGMTIAKIFAFSLKKEITTLSSLEAMAYSSNLESIKVPILDARRGYVYAGVYDENNNIILDDQYISLEKLQKYLDSLKKEYIFITNDSKLANLNRIKYNPDILKIVNIVKDRKSINPHLVEPLYLKLTEAEENLGSKNDNRVTE